MIKEITTLIPVYNTNPAHLYEAVNSILNQSWKGENTIIIIDDGSENDSTLNAIKELFHRDIISARGYDRNQGAAVALNEGHKLVETEYVAIHGSQDISHPDRFKKQIEFLEQNPEIDVLGTNLFSFFDEDIFRKPIFTSKHSGEINKSHSGGSTWFTNHGTVIYKQSSVIAAGGYNTAFRRAQDVELWGRMVKAGFKITNLTEVLYAWRKHK